MLPKVFSSPIRVLVIDDDPMILELVQKMLGRQYDVAVEDDPISALSDLLEDPPYEAILCDIQMQRATGPEIFSVLQRSGVGAASKFAFMTGSVTGAQELRRSFPGPILLKPFTTAGLVAAITAVRFKGPAEPYSRKSTVTLS